MTERPILFTPDNVRKILDGHKTQTRRPLKQQPTVVGAFHWWKEIPVDTMPETVAKHCPFGQVGDRLWVRETWYPAFKRTPKLCGCVYKADDDGRHLNPGWTPHDGWKPSIHMPRWASRLTLEITAIRVEKVCKISRADALAEGMPDQSPMTRFAERWDSINAKRGYGWEKNPWVWCLSFRRVDAS